MANNLDFSQLEKIMSMEAKKFTPEYMEQLSKSAYKEDREYPENFSNWFPHIKNIGTFNMADVISNQIFTWEECEIMQETDDINKVNWDKINEILKPTLDKMERYQIYSIKNGCFSNKFEFNTCLATRDNLAEQLWKINYQSSMFETGGYTELVVRKYIPDDLQHCLTIYNGMPLRTEVRVFYNMETKKIEYLVDYWNYEYCHNSLHTLNDKLIFDIFHNKIEKVDVTLHELEYNRIVKIIEEKIDTLEFDGELEGIWSIDFMYDEWTNKIYLIDMARGFRSAYWDINKLSSLTREKLLQEKNK